MCTVPQIIFLPSIFEFDPKPMITPCKIARPKDVASARALGGDVIIDVRVDIELAIGQYQQ
jgi:hypothetical protein